MWRIDAEAQARWRDLGQRARVYIYIYIYIYIYCAPQNCNNVMSNNLMCAEILW